MQPHETELPAPTGSLERKEYFVGHGQGACTPVCSSPLLAFDSLGEATRLCPGPLVFRCSFVGSYNWDCHWILRKQEVNQFQFLFCFCFFFFLVVCYCHNRKYQLGYNKMGNRHSPHDLGPELRTGCFLIVQLNS